MTLWLDLGRSDWKELHARGSGWGLVPVVVLGGLAYLCQCHSFKAGLKSLDNQAQTSKL